MGITSTVGHLGAGLLLAAVVLVGTAMTPAATAADQEQQLETPSQLVDRIQERYDAAAEQLPARLDTLDKERRIHAERLLQRVARHLEDARRHATRHPERVARCIDKADRALERLEKLTGIHLDGDQEVQP